MGLGIQKSGKYCLLSMHIPDDVNLAVNMQAHLLELRTSFLKPYLVIIYKHKSIVKPTYALIQPAANLNL